MRANEEVSANACRTVSMEGRLRPSDVFAFAIAALAITVLWPMRSRDPTPAKFTG